MDAIKIGYISKVTSHKVNIVVTNEYCITRLSNNLGDLNFVTIGCYLQNTMPNGDLVILRCDEIVKDDDVIVIASYVGIYDEIIKKFTDGVTKYPLINDYVFTAKEEAISGIVSNNAKNIIGKYYFDDSINISYDPNVLFGKHLGVFGNTGSGKTCTVVSLIQNYIRNNDTNAKFLILDVNGEYREAFDSKEMDYYEFADLKFSHTILSLAEYGKLFRASEGMQYPALKKCISDLGTGWNFSDLVNKLDAWARSNSKDNFSLNQIQGYLRTMLLRIDTIMSDVTLCEIIDDSSSINTLELIKNSPKKVSIINLNVSDDSLDIVLFLIFKSIYLSKVIKRDFNDHLVMVLEEAHRYINNDSDGTRLGNFFIDKLAREGRKFGLGLVISSQVPSMLSYSIVSQCNSIIMHKITSKKDNDYLRGILRISSDVFFDQMNSLPKQHAIVCGEAFKSDVVIKVKDANPLPNSSDPIIE